MVAQLSVRLEIKEGYPSSHRKQIIEMCAGAIKFLRISVYRCTNMAGVSNLPKKGEVELFSVSWLGK